jgi:hypothetical protein
MQTLRQARFLARLVLAWFALALGVAIASPIVKPQAMELVCSSGGAVKLIVVGDGDATGAPGHTLDCPLCLAGNAPPPSLALPDDALVAKQTPFRRVAHAEPLASRTAAPLPPRGPPALS